MTRPTGASFAQFFPAASRAARDRAMEREKVKMKAQETPLARPIDINGYHAPLNPSASSHNDDEPATGFISRPQLNGTAAHAAHPPTDDTESLAGDTLHAGGSASSHTSASSSVFGAPTRPSATAAMKFSNTQLTPPTTIASPSSYLSTAAPTKAQSTTPRRADGINRLNGLTPIPNGSVHYTPAVERVPARDPSRSIKCIKRTYEPFFDTSLASSEKRKAKPIYKEFGMVCAFNNFTLREGERHLDYGSIG
ncbi:hypothetical protein F5144DRAFT_118887 [Chaetomium tenue]|uniref:Uncharacterized protein n=1 Tax=Chaetomium tenue TaxID=1854479 RepID=A0ACB7PGC4_9PEZI|nr:hypothetical protein F5144DRAFT_118887 [Chaetomium globosum]